MKNIKKIIKIVLHYPINILINIALIYSNILSKFTKKLYFEDEVEKRERQSLTLKLDENIELKFSSFSLPSCE